MKTLIRWLYALRTIRSYASRLDRCVSVENVLFAVAAGKRPMLTRDECRELAIKLGTAANWDRGSAKVGGEKK
jgi:hypothetical protein